MFGTSTSAAEWPRRAAAALCAAALVVLSACAAGTGTQSAMDARPAPDGDALAEVPPADRLYVTNQNSATVSVIDLGTLEVVRTLDLQEYGFSAHAKPHDVVIEPDGSAWYVSLIGDNTIVKFSGRGELIGRAPFEVPGMLTLHPGGERLYATHTMSVPNPPRRIAEVGRAAMRKLEEIGTFFPRPHGIDVHPSGDYLYTASLAVNKLGVLNTRTGEYELIELDGPNPVLAHTAVSPDGSTLAVSTQAGEVYLFDLSDPAEPRLVARVPVGTLPWRPAFTPDGRRLYVPNKGSNTVSVIDVRTREVVAVIDHPAIAQPYAAIVSPDGSRVFVASSNTKADWAPAGAAAAEDPVGNVVVIDTATNEVVEVIPVGQKPTGLAIPGAPD